MVKRSLCCGGTLRRRRVQNRTPLPPNPRLKEGVDVVYLGSGDVSIVGEVTKLNYFASDHRRHLRVASDDAPGILRRRDFIQAP